ncbi:hypothetical protein NDN08_005560 [Rhodosorus marinus]|uniref:Mediator of RNA polymerase II transcription subunit 10 n=1 Tax=Rhodosorus marinus TaxID=101924 RepID=A0AAV8V1Z1_9RHOD|nr:hypothetical protein NDN08_005560 [Rhodosorus marinus]
MTEETGVEKDVNGDTVMINDDVDDAVQGDLVAMEEGGPEASKVPNPVISENADILDAAVAELVPRDAEGGKEPPIEMVDIEDDAVTGEDKLDGSKDEAQQWDSSNFVQEIGKPQADLWEPGGAPEEAAAGDAEESTTEKAAPEDQPKPQDSGFAEPNPEEPPADNEEPQPEGAEAQISEVQKEPVMRTERAGGDGSLPLQPVVPQQSEPLGTSAPAASEVKGTVEETNGAGSDPAKLDSASATQEATEQADKKRTEENQNPVNGSQPEEGPKVEKQGDEGKDGKGETRTKPAAPAVPLASPPSGALPPQAPLLAGEPPPKAKAPPAVAPDRAPSVTGADSAAESAGMESESSAPSASPPTGGMTPLQMSQGDGMELQTSPELIELERALENTAETLNQIAVMVTNFSNDDQNNLFAKVNQLTVDLRELDMRAGTVNTNVPFQVLEAIDRGRNPLIVTQELLEMCEEANSAALGKLNIMKTFSDSLAEKVAQSRISNTVETVAKE